MYSRHVLILYANSEVLGGSAVSRLSKTPDLLGLYTIRRFKPQENGCLVSLKLKIRSYALA